MIESIFSYVFGDGDPNKGLEDEQLRRAAQIIRESGGAVAAEQLSTILDPPDLALLTALDSNTGGGVGGVGGAVVDEQWMLPAIIKLGGRPEVTDDGDIVYGEFVESLKQLITC